MNKIILNTDICIGCGACVHIDPEHFDFNDDDLAMITNNIKANGNEYETNSLHNAIESCPVNAITIEPSNESNCSNEDCECEDCNCEDECNCNNEAANENITINLNCDCANCDHKC